MYRPLYTANSLATNYNNVNDFMRTTDVAVNGLKQQFNTSGTAISLIKAASVTTATTTFPHSLKYIPTILCRIENNTTTPGEWHSDRYESFNLTSGILDGLAYVSADSTNIYLKAVTPSGGALYASLLTFNAVYFVVGGA